jgi:hypothetical protein
MNMVRLVLLGLAVALFVGVLDRSASARGGASPLPPARVAPADGLEKRHGDTLLSGVIRSEARTRSLLARPGDAIWRRCVKGKQRRLLRLVRAARRARRRGAAGRVKLTRAYLEAIILAGEARRCGQEVIAGVPPGKTLVTVEVAPSRAPRRGWDATW